MAAPLTGLGSRPAIPDVPRCACGCGQAAPRGFPGDLHYAHACVPAHLRFPWEPGYAALAAESDLPAAIPAVVTALITDAIAPDLFSGSVPA